MACGDEAEIQDSGVVAFDAATSSPDAGDADAGFAEDAGAASDAGVEALEIIGGYTDNYGISHEITAEEWIVQGARHRIVEYDNEADVLFAQNTDDHPYDPGLWSRFDWTAFDGGQLPDRLQGRIRGRGPRAHTTAPNRSGCGNFPWSRLGDL